MFWIIISVLVDLLRKFSLSGKPLNIVSKIPKVGLRHCPDLVRAHLPYIGGAWFERTSEKRYA